MTADCPQDSFQTFVSYRGDIFLMQNFSNMERIRYAGTSNDCFQDQPCSGFNRVPFLGNPIDEILRETRLAHERCAKWHAAIHRHVPVSVRSSL